MGIYAYLERVFFGLPTSDSRKLIAAKKYNPSFDEARLGLAYDLYRKKMDPFMFGAITPTSDDNDLLDSKEIEKRAQMIYDLCEK